MYFIPGMWWDVDRGQTGMSETNLKADQDAFLKENGYGKLIEEHSKVYIWSERKCTALQEVLMTAKIKVFILFFP